MIGMRSATLPHKGYWLTEKLRVIQAASIHLTCTGNLAEYPTLSDEGREICIELAKGHEKVISYLEMAVNAPQDPPNFNSTYTEKFFSRFFFASLLDLRRTLRQFGRKVILIAHTPEFAKIMKVFEGIVETICLYYEYYGLIEHANALRENRDNGRMSEMCVDMRQYSPQLEPRYMKDLKKICEQEYPVGTELNFVTLPGLIYEDDDEYESIFDDEDFRRYFYDSEMDGPMEDRPGYPQEARVEESGREKHIPGRAKQTRIEQETRKLAQAAETKCLRDETLRAREEFRRVEEAIRISQRRSLPATELLGGELPPWQVKLPQPPLPDQRTFVGKLPPWQVEQRDDMTLLQPQSPETPPFMGEIPPWQVDQPDNMILLQPPLPDTPFYQQTVVDMPPRHLQDPPPALPYWAPRLAHPTPEPTITPAAMGEYLVYNTEPMALRPQIESPVMFEGMSMESMLNSGPSTNQPHNQQPNDGNQFLYQPQPSGGNQFHNLQHPDSYPYHIQQHPNGDEYHNQQHPYGGDQYHNQHQIQQQYPGGHHYYY
ncbi:hypothetical protein RUND412_001600 [Rhizina undulata]